jgi:hypothetical protein
MPHRLKTPRWYKKRKIQIENMDIWNVAFPEGAVIDPNTAWKVFWKTAASMYGDGGFREEGRFHESIDNVSYGIYWSDFSHNPEPYLFATRARIVRDEFSYICQVDPSENVAPTWYSSPDHFMNDYASWCITKCAADLRRVYSRYYKVSLFVQDDKTGCAPSLVLFKEWESIIHKQARHGYVRRHDNVDVRQLHEPLQRIFGPRVTEQTRTSVDSVGRRSYASVTSFIPTEIPMKSDFLQINWPQWWVRICEGDSVAYPLACLLWCDWTIANIRQLLYLDSQTSRVGLMNFNFTKSCLMPRDQLSENLDSRSLAIMYHLNNPLSYIPSDY